jgi:hypothetical protein
MYSRHEEAIGQVAAPLEAVFTFLDDHERLASHMSKRSWMMGGGKMDTILDEAHGQQVGSRFTVRGRVFGFRLSLDERVIERVPPSRKAWETEGEPRLLVVGAHRMGFDLASGTMTTARVWIDYDLPSRGIGRWIGTLLGSRYARWCVRRMLGDVQRAFAVSQASPDKQLAQPRPTEGSPSGILRHAPDSRLCVRDRPRPACARRPDQRAIL